MKLLLSICLFLLINYSQQQFQISSSSSASTPTAGGLSQNIYQFLQSLPAASKFVQGLASISQNLQDTSIVNALSGNPSPMYQSQNGYTVFVPTNDALINVPNDIIQLRNDFNNFIIRDRLTLDRLRELNGRNLSSTFGILPRLYVKIVRNFYIRQLNPTISGVATTTPMYNQQQQQQQNLYPNQQQQVYNSQNYNNSNIYTQFNSMYGSSGQTPYSGPSISIQFPQDELFLINDAILLDKYETANGIIYLMSTYPRYYDQSVLQILQSNSVPSLSQNLNFIQSEATRARRNGNDNLENALKVVGANTYFLPSDAAFSKYTDRDKLSNFTFLYEILFKSHRISNQILFDYYLDGPTTYYTDTLLPVNTIHRRLTGQTVDDIEISIGHVRGKILPDLRNIFCFSGIIHVIDTVLAVPTKSAYQELIGITQLGTFRQLIDRSAKYRQLFDQLPTQIVYPTQPPLRNMQLRNQRQKRQSIGSTDIRYMTILAPNDAALFNVRDMLLQNDTALDEFLSTHIIIDNEQNRVFYTDHDQNVFTNGQRYTTMNPNAYLVATVTQLETEVTNRVVFQVQGRSNLQARVVDGNTRAMNGVIHVVDRALIQYINPDITNVLDKYSSVQTGTGAPSFSQFLDALKATGIYNELKQPAKQFTLFIPTNEALSRYQNIVNDMNLRKQFLYRHICYDINLRSDTLDQYSTGTNQYYNQQQQQQQQQYNNNNPNQNTQLSTTTGPQVSCRNRLGQEMILTKDTYSLIVRLNGVASSRTINDFPGQYASAYVLERPILNALEPGFALDESINSSNQFKSKLILLAISILINFIIKKL